MRKFFIAALIIVASLSLTNAQSQQGNSQDAEQIPNMGRAPKQENGVGRLDLRVVDENGNPVEGAFARLESSRSDGYFCEAWNSTNSKGVAVLPPLHMGKLKLIIKAKGYETLKIEVPADSLSEPVRVVLAKK
ncbi:MAG TPA: carboxypeptidase-like regulatory domain-containing protein [Pyrinomonadaceae bacterium]